jgi:hypothetical protein
MMTGMFFWARNCFTRSDVWLSVLSWSRYHCPYHLSRCFLRTAPRNLCKTST